jgi:hypothetical protein
MPGVINAKEAKNIADAVKVHEEKHEISSWIWKKIRSEASRGNHRCTFDGFRFDYADKLAERLRGLGFAVDVVPWDGDRLWWNTIIVKWEL